MAGRVDSQGSECLGFEENLAGQTCIVVGIDDGRTGGNEKRGGEVVEDEVVVEAEMVVVEELKEERRNKVGWRGFGDGRIKQV